MFSIKIDCIHASLVIFRFIGQSFHFSVPGKLPTMPLTVKMTLSLSTRKMNDSVQKKWGMERIHKHLCSAKIMSLNNMAICTCL